MGEGIALSWIVLGEKNNLVELRSVKSKENEDDGLLPIGSFLTVETGKESKVILRVEQSNQSDPYAPTALLAEMNLEGLIQDVKCYNLVKARRIQHITNRIDGKYDFIRARQLARRSTNEEIKEAFKSSDSGPKIFPATMFSGENSLISGNNNELLHVQLDEEMFWHQMAICGAMGQGKTVAMKYLSQYFVEEMGGCVIALNVKDDDLLHMEKESIVDTPEIRKEWESIGIEPKGIINFQIYHPFGDNYDPESEVDQNRLNRITLSTSDINPESLLGLVRNQMTAPAARWFPDIFRWWQDAHPDGRFIEFQRWFDHDDRENVFNTLDINNNEGSRALHHGTVGNISSSIGSAVKFFEVEGSDPIDIRLFLEKGKYSTVDLSPPDGIEFGSIFLRHILSELKKEKKHYADLPVLIIIDEVHNFHSAGEGTKEALQYLNNICRQGRQSKIGIIFASQDLATMPKGITNIVNTIISFRTTDITTARKFSVSSEEMTSLDKGYAVGILHNIKNLKFIKFPLSVSGVIR